MKYSLLTKFAAIVLCAFSLLTCLACGSGVILCESQELYTENPEIWLEDHIQGVGEQVGSFALTLYGAEHLGHCPPAVLEYLKTSYYYSTGYQESDYAVAISQYGNALVSPASIPENALIVYHEIFASYPTVVSEDVDESQFYRVDDTWLVNDDTGEVELVKLAYRQASSYDVAVYLSPELADVSYTASIQLLFNCRYYFIIFLGLGLLIFPTSLSYLCRVAGRRYASDEIRPGALNRLPLDLYLVVTLSCCLYAYSQTGSSLYVWAFESNWGMLTCSALVTLVASLILVGFIFACSAQSKCYQNLWWRRTITGRLAIRLWRVVKWISKGIASLAAMLPLVWQWLCAIFLMIICPLGVLLAASRASEYAWTLVLYILCGILLTADVALILHWAWSMGQLLKGAQCMSRGDMQYQIPTRFLLGGFKEFANAINSTAGAARIAVEQQLKSERMKTELITNVSHDIKTPLTSIINYVDLLKMPHDDAQEQQYLEVLDRQSQRLKKLIVDLMEMSKANTGNLPVELETMDAVEAINQALGEFSDKMAAAGLEPLFHTPQEQVMIRADGRLLWRVLSNLLGNAVKYAMPGTRLYLDLLVDDHNAILNMKNISRDQLNVAADELLERFVRGDISRNTEGSGLGLNIAKSLMELQQGEMQLMVDGDLFKVTLILPLAKE